MWFIFALKLTSICLSMRKFSIFCAGETFLLCRRWCLIYHSHLLLISFLPGFKFIARELLWLIWLWITAFIPQSTKSLPSSSADFVTKEELNASIASLRKENKEFVLSTLTSFTSEIKDTIRSELRDSKTSVWMSERKGGSVKGNGGSEKAFDGRPICNSYSHMGHIARTCRFTPTRPPIACLICGQVGHISRQCPSRLSGSLRQDSPDAGSSENSTSNQPNGNNTGTSSISSN